MQTERFKGMKEGMDALKEFGGGFGNCRPPSFAMTIGRLRSTPLVVPLQLHKLHPSDPSDAAPPHLEPLPHSTLGISWLSFWR